MASGVAVVCSSSSVAAAVAVAPSSSSQKTVFANNVGAAKASFLVGRAVSLRQSKAAMPRRAAVIVSEAVQTERPLWFPGTTPPPWLDGSLPADFGFDPLGLGSDPETLKWNVQSELVHCRWAMLGAAGIFIPELLTKLGILNTDPIFPNNKLTGTDVGYPGGLWFDPLGWGSGSPEKIKELRTKEIKNGRLAMLSVMGAWFQAEYTGTGPIDNLLAHLADPGHATVFAAFSSK
uniref:Chlorophyll a-b binding protein, chloroplastic n=1 Tax=Picea sitchensis TaxID=3332 RepID=A9NQF7_PICSI|nr:unknown [Picea sitchensis]